MEHLWCHRVLSCNDHVRRGAAYNHICAELLAYHDSNWLQNHRSQWVSASSTDFNGGRNTLDRGRTGTRLNIGRPQVRWEDGTKVARGIIQEVDGSVQGRSKVTIGTAIRNLVQRISRLANSADMPGWLLKQLLIARRILGNLDV